MHVDLVLSFDLAGSATPHMELAALKMESYNFTMTVDSLRLVLEITYFLCVLAQVYRQISKQVRRKGKGKACIKSAYFFEWLGVALNLTSVCMWVAFITHPDRLAVVAKLEAYEGDGEVFHEPLSLARLVLLEEAYVTVNAINIIYQTFRSFTYFRVSAAPRTLPRTRHREPFLVFPNARV